MKSDINLGITTAQKTRKSETPTKMQRLLAKRRKGEKLTSRELSYLSDNLSSSTSDLGKSTISRNKVKY